MFPLDAKIISSLTAACPPRQSIKTSKRNFTRLVISKFVPTCSSRNLVARHNKSFILNRPSRSGQKHRLSNPRAIINLQTPHFATHLNSHTCERLGGIPPATQTKFESPASGYYFSRTETSLTGEGFAHQPGIARLVLVCPICKTPVVLTPSGEGLRCAKCHLIYPIRDGFPIMIKDEAISEPAVKNERPESPKS